MKMINVKEWIYKGCFISEQKHPKLTGKYEVFKNNEVQTRIGRVNTLVEGRKMCKENECFDNFLKF